MVAEKFQIYTVKITANTFYICELKKLNLFIFTHATKQNSPPGSCHYPDGRRELPILPEQHFWNVFFLEEKGGRGLCS